MTVYLGNERKSVTASMTLTHATVPELTTWTGMCNIWCASTIYTHLQTYWTIYTIKQLTTVVLTDKGEEECVLITEKH